MFAIIEMYEYSIQDKRYFSGILEGKSSAPRLYEAARLGLYGKHLRGWESGRLHRTTPAKAIDFN